MKDFIAVTERLPEKDCEVKVRINEIELICLFVKEFESFVSEGGIMITGVTGWRLND